MFEVYISNDYARAFAILIGVFIILKLFVFVVEKIIFFFTKKTKTGIDDLILQKTSKPLTAIILLIGVWFAFNEIPFPEIVLGFAFKILYSLIMVVVFYVVFALLDLFLLAGWRKISIKAKTGLDESAISLVRGILKFIWIILALLYILDLWGVQIGPFLAGLGIAGLAVALALQPTLSNIFSGLSIILDKSIRVNDLVYLDADTKGKILKIGLRSTKILTFDNELVILPNSKLAESRIQNVALPEPKSRAVVAFGVAYGSNIDKVKKIVLKEIKSIKNLINDPEPSVKFLEMADSSLNFKAYFYVDSFEHRFAAIDEANTKIYNALNKNKISIPFPQMDVYLKK